MQKKIFLIVLCLIIITIYNKTNETIIIPTSAIRLRVIPNSNSPLDINIKEKIKTSLEENLYSKISKEDNINNVRNIIENNIPIIENNINQIFKENNYQETFKINYGMNYFPEKTYQGITYNEGYYESLVISIGEANGSNFWCVLYPNLCLIDNSKEIKYKSYFKELINKIIK